MNSFTKEELEEIKRCLKYMISGSVTPYSSLTLKLKNKINTIIDNYCLHKKDVWPLYTSTGDIPIAGFCYECGFPVDKKYVNE